MEENVAAVLRTDKEEKVSALLRNYIEHLRTQAGLITDPTIKDQVELEVQEIKKYINQLNTIQ